MPYTIRKQKCKKSDGGSGSYVLSYTDRHGKKHRNCHTSRKGAQGQIGAIEGPKEGDGPEGELELVREWIKEALLLEAGVEHQERALVKLIQATVRSNKGKPITLVAGDVVISNVTGAAKVEGTAPYGGEPYTDVIFWIDDDHSTSPTDTSMNISCKIEGGAPSVINLSKSGLKQCYPGWYEAINKAALDKYKEMGAKAGHWSVRGAQISGGKDDASNLYNVLKRIHPSAKGKISIHTTDGTEYQLDKGEKPPVAAGFGPKPAKIDKNGRIHFYNTSEVSVPDLFGIIPPDVIKTMFVGNTAMGGPVTYIYEGPANPAVGSSFKRGKLTIPGIFKTANSLIKVNADDGQSTGAKSVALRIRKRRFDAAVADSGEALVSGPITSHPNSGVKGGGGIRFVSTMKSSNPKDENVARINIPVYGIDVEPPTGWSPGAPCSQTSAPSLEESASTLKLTVYRLRQLIREELKTNPSSSWKSKRWLFLDTETTGIGVDKGHRVWEIGWAYVNGMQVRARGNWIIDPGRDMDPEASVVTGVTSSEWAGQGPFESIAPKLARLIAHSDVVLAYNAPFDRAFIANEFKLSGVEMPNKPWLDPLVWVKRFVPSDNHRLKTMTDRYEIVLDRAHRADADAEAAALLTIKFLQAAEGASIADDPHEVEATDAAWREEQRQSRFKRRRG